MKIFLWKVSSNTFRTRHNLYKRKVAEEGSCVLCQQAKETTVHVLWSCTTTSDVLPIHSPFSKWFNYFSDFKILWSKIANKLDKSVLEEVAFILQKIWLHRSANVFQKKKKNSIQTLCCKEQRRNTSLTAWPIKRLERLPLTPIEMTYNGSRQMIDVSRPIRTLQLIAK